VNQPRLLALFAARLSARRHASKVRVFNNVPVGGRVDTKVSCPLPWHLTTRAILLGILPSSNRDS